MADLARVCAVSTDGLRIRLRVQPRSSRNRIAGVHGQALKVCVTAPPVDGAANTAVIALLAEVLGVPKGTIAIVTGVAGRDKQVRVSSSSCASLLAKLEAAAAACVDKPKVGD